MAVYALKRYRAVSIPGANPIKIFLISIKTRDNTGTLVRTVINK